MQSDKWNKAVFVDRSDYCADAQPKPRPSEKGSARRSKQDKHHAVQGIQDVTTIDDRGDEELLSVIDEEFNEEETSVDNTQGRKRILEQRCKWALIHFYALRPAFSVSLILYLASLTSGRGAMTFRSGVIVPIQNLAGLVQMESKAYTNCVRDSTNRTAKRLEKLAREDRDRARGVLKKNSEMLQRAEELTGECAHDVQKARESLIQWRTDGMDIPWKDVLDADGGNFIPSQNSSCTAKRRNETEQILGQDYHVTETQSKKALETFVSNSRVSLKAVSDYSLERLDYDWNYFIVKRIQPALDYLAEHSVYIQTVDIDLSYNMTAIEQTIQKQISSVQQALKEAKQNIETLQEKLEEFRYSIKGLYVNYNELYNQMVRATEFVYEFLPPGMPLPDVFDISGFDLADSFLPPSGLGWPEIDIENIDIQQISQGIANSCNIILVQILENARIQSLHGLHETVRNLSQDLTEILELKNYHPPQYQGTHSGILDINHELDFQSLRGREALNLTQQAMTDLRAHSSVFDNFPIDKIEIPTIGKIDYNYTQEASTTFELVDIIMPSFSFLEFVLTKIAMLGDYAFVLDILCGFIQWWKLSSMYEKGAMPNMPQIDYGDGDQDTRQRPQANHKIFIFIAKSFMNPVVVGFLFILSFFGFLVINFWIPHVQQMCIESSNGTWFANNMLGPILTNVAMTGGNAQYLLAEHSCYSLQNQLCKGISMEKETQYLADRSALENFQSQHNRSLEALDLMGDCVDSTNITNMVAESCCGLKGYKITDCDWSSNYTCPIDSSTSPPSAYRPFEEYLQSSSCLENIQEWTFEGEEYECDMLNEACHHIPCSGVNEEWIQRFANQTDCKVELWFIYCCRFWGTVILQFTSLHMMCSLIYLGCRDLNWRKISPDFIGLHTYLLETGILSKGDELEERSERISDEIKWFERKARLQVFLGVLLLLVYIVVLVTFSLKS